MNLVMAGVSYNKLRHQVPIYVAVADTVTKSFAAFAGVEVQHAIALPSGTAQDNVQFSAQVGVSLAEEAAMAKKLTSGLEALAEKVQQAVSAMDVSTVKSSPSAKVTVYVERFVSGTDTIVYTTTPSPTVAPTPVPTPAPTPAPDPTKPEVGNPYQAKDKVTINFKILNVDYKAMSEDMKRVAKEKIAVGIAADTPGVSASDVAVKLSAGSVVVEATITLADGASAESIRSAVVSSTTFEIIVMKHFLTVPDLGTVTQGQVTVSNVDVVVVKPTTAAPVDQPGQDLLAQGLVTDTARRSQSCLAIVFLLAVVTP